MEKASIILETKPLKHHPFWLSCLIKRFLGTYREIKCLRHLCECRAVKYSHQRQWGSRNFAAV